MQNYEKYLSLLCNDYINKLFFKKISDFWLFLFIPSATRYTYTQRGSGMTPGTSACIIAVLCVVAMFLFRLLADISQDTSVNIEHMTVDKVAGI